MDKQLVDKKAETVNIPAKSKREFFLLHGYTGSPTDFNELGKYLNKKFNANVKIIRLRGHGEKLENLNGLNYRDFLLQAEEELKKELSKGMEIVLGGISLGSFIAFQLSTKYPVKGVIAVSTISKYTLPMNILNFFEPLIIKKSWKKRMTKEEKELRKKAFYYDATMGGLKMVNQAKKELKEIWKKVTAPCLIIHVKKDKIFHEKGVFFIKEKISSKISEVFFLEGTGKVSHNPFYCPGHELIYPVVGDFVKKNKLFL